MSDNEKKPTPGEKAFSQQVASKAARKIKAQRHRTRTVWSGLGMMGLIGWSVVIPTLLGAAAGLWLDDRVSLADGFWRRGAGARSLAI